MLAELAVTSVGEIDWNGHMDVDGAGWIWMALGMVAFWGLLLFAAVRIVRATSSDSPATPREVAVSAAGILDRRLAEGDISLEDYRNRRRAIVAGAPDSDSAPSEGRAG